MKTTDPKTIELHTRLWENEVRVAQMWPFPGGAGFRELLEDLDDDQIPTEIMGLITNWTDEEKDMLFSGGPDSHEAFDQLCAAAVQSGVYGFFGVVHTPVMSPIGSGHYAYSWSYHHVDYLFAPTADAFLEQAALWAEAREAADKSK